MVTPDLNPDLMTHTAGSGTGIPNGVEDFDSDYEDWEGVYWDGSRLMYTLAELEFSNPNLDNAKTRLAALNGHISNAEAMGECAMRTQLLSWVRQELNSLRPD